MIAKLIVLVLFVSTGSAHFDADWSLLTGTPKCRAVFVDQPEVDLFLPRYGSYCGVKWGMQPQCSKFVDFFESCCLQMFKDQTNNYNFTKPYWMSQNGPPLGDSICEKIQEKGSDQVGKKLALQFGYTCRPGYYSDPETIKWGEWANEFENITVSFDLLKKIRNDVKVCCKDGKYTGAYC